MSLMMGPSSWVLANTCDIYPATIGQDIEGGATFVYPASPSAQLACSAQPNEVVETIGDDRMTRETTWRIMFGAPTGIKNRDMIIITDDAGVRHTAFAHIEQNQAGRGSAYVVYAVEKT